MLFDLIYRYGSFDAYTLTLKTTIEKEKNRKNIFEKVGGGKTRLVDDWLTEF